MKENLILIGFMGSGKSTVGRILAKELETIMIDTDSLIESMQNKSIKEIFEVHGESYFRNLESDLSIWIQSHLSSTVVSTGGGFVNVKNISSIGIKVYLKVSFEDIQKRLCNLENSHEINNRPLFKDINKAKELYKVRESIYSKNSDFTIEIEKQTPLEIAHQIKKLIKE